MRGGRPLFLGSIKFAALLTLVLALFPALAPAQRVRRDGVGNLYGPGLEQVAPVTIEKFLRDPVCRELTLEIRHSAPTNTGSLALDKFLAADLEKSVQESLAGFSGMGGYDCDGFGDGESTSERTFEIHDSGGGIVSIVYAIFGMHAGAAHGYEYFRSINFNVANGRELTMGDLFTSPPGAAEGLKAFWPYVAKAWCSYNDERRIPNFYEMREDNKYCSNPARAPMPARLRGQPAIADLGNAYFTRQGMILKLAPYDGWSYARGPSSLSFKKEGLVMLGFNPAIWGR